MRPRCCFLVGARALEVNDGRLSISIVDAVMLNQNPRAVQQGCDDRRNEGAPIGSAFLLSDMQQYRKLMIASA